MEGTDGVRDGLPDDLSHDAMVILAPPGHEDPSGNPPGSLATDLENPSVDRISDAHR